ncbi:MAG: TRAP transporter small permease [Candidatus Sericytochromatia bacterium]|nr:TRAP transporter small permease [Candidatus Tanganyikabacteria bacterium]
MSTAPIPSHQPTPSGELQAFEQHGIPAEAPLLAPLHAVDKAIGFAERAVLILLVFAMILLGSYQVIMRELFDKGLPWADPLLRHLVLVTGMVGAMVATEAGRHLNMDALARVMPEGARRWVDVIVNLVSGATCVYLTVLAVQFVRDEMTAQGHEIAFGLQAWQVQIIFPISFGVMAFRFLLFFVDGLLGTREVPSHEPKAL